MAGRTTRRRWPVTCLALAVAGAALAGLWALLPADPLEAARRWTLRPGPYLAAQKGWTASSRLTPLLRQPKNRATGAMYRVRRGAFRETGAGLGCAPVALRALESLFGGGPGQSEIPDQSVRAS
jgi:hypothetical protein